MTISFLQLQNFRNFSNYSFVPDKKINLIVGANASGKSSLLESIFFLFRGKSFRSSEKNLLIKRETEEAVVFASVYINGNPTPIPVGIRKTFSSIELHVNETKHTSIATIAKLLPVQIVHPESHKLIEGGPVFRREFLDWGVFHVEQEFYLTWYKYKQGLKQRNAALKMGKDRLSILAWDCDLATHANKITELRKKYLNLLKPFLYKYIGNIFDFYNCEVSFYSGWDEGFSLEEQLFKNIEKDILRGHTSIGPHRANFSIQKDGLHIENIVSRGQQKLLVISLVLAQIAMLNEVTKKHCVFLIDDLESELDFRYQEKIRILLQQLDVQLFITTISDTAFKYDNILKLNLVE